MVDHQKLVWKRQIWKEMLGKSRKLHTDILLLLLLLTGSTQNRQSLQLDYNTQALCNLQRLQHKNSKHFNTRQHCFTQALLTNFFYLKFSESLNQQQLDCPLISWPCHQPCNQSCSRVYLNIYEAHSTHFHICIQILQKNKEVSSNKKNSSTAIFRGLHVQANFEIELYSFK